MIDPEQKTFILGLGFQRCGTTWLHRYLAQFEFFDGGFAKEYHVWDALDLPLLRTTLAPKPSLFDMTLRRSQALRYKMQNETQFYFEYFGSLYDDTNIRLSADITPSYCGLSKDRLDFIRGGFEQRGINCRVVLLMRNPVSRIKSAVRFNMDRKKYDEGIKPGETDFSRAVRQYYASEHCQMRTNYHETIRNVSESFEAENIYVGVYENMFEEQEIERLSAFLGVTPNIDFGSVQVNKTRSTIDSDDTLEREVMGYYKDVYDFCYEKFPQTRGLWG
jgi:hypothetical protein